MNKPLDAAEVKVYGKKARSILVLELSIFILLIILEAKELGYCISISLLMLSFMTIMGKIKNNSLKEL